MTDTYRLSLSYPNPSLSQMATVDRIGSPRCRKESATTAMHSNSERRVKGARQGALMAALLVGLLFSSLDTSIVSTSLVTISRDLQNFVDAPWVIIAYLLTYMGFAIFISKLSDIYGRRNMIILSWILFIGFSLGCGSAQSMPTLIVCRAFQGVGASGLYSLTQIGLVEIGPLHRPSLIGALIGTTLAIAFVLGPILGGIISEYSDWRWLFNMNIPFGLVTILAITNFWPEENTPHLFSWNAFVKIDFLGSVTLLCSSGLLVFAIQQAGSQTFAWSSPEIISAFVISGMSWCVFVWWEVLLSMKRYRRIEPIFPIRLVFRRVYLSGLLVTFLTGFPYISLSVIIPERFQMVNNERVLVAGLRILPLLGGCAAGSFLGGAVSSKKNNTSYTLIAASCLQVAGVGLLTTVSGVNSSTTAQYGFQAIFGLGVGLSFSAATIMTNIMTTERNELASAQGAIAQARVFGGSIGLSLCTVLFNLHVNRNLKHHLADAQLDGLRRSPLSGLSLPKNLQYMIKATYASAFTEEVKAMAIVCAVMVVVSFFAWERNPAPLEGLTGQSKEDAISRRASDSETEMNDRLGT